MDRRNIQTKLSKSFIQSIKYILIVYLILILIEAVFYSKAHNGFFNALYFALSVLLSFPGIIGTIILWIIVGSILFFVKIIKKKK